ncbi:sulfurtransferase [Rhizobium wenxiniae]|uniref:Thiosulfate/3-mercaptopyruvate sulfurtransferase n=1 Tax=Rhizobium wenxiniae TaxID=1737357 RepID=A0A7X0CYU8_9HYPH|nr:sulfurtransferase [Rhizobium wenxiniae]MBB6161649.1 thiosulfate/3-mercaptopyruvate sulfurtransferase [Rhizobium wenxiniae]GGF90497.1 sulfurtransferase [Rhizobium wenxiniae]
MTYQNSRNLASVEEISTQLDDPNVVILDCTSTVIPTDGGGGFAVADGREAFEAGHIPGAQFVNLQRDLSTPSDHLLFTLPSAEQFGNALNRLGVGAESRVILYSTGQPGWAARVWLMLRAFGFENAAVLNGGWKAWTNAGLPVETGAAKPRSAASKPFGWTYRPGFFVASDEVVARAEGDALVNALGPDSFRGEAPIAYGRPGRIPGSVNVPTSSLVDPETGLYLSQQQIEKIFADAGVRPDAQLIAYCGAGVAASNVVFARTLSGADARSVVYDGSLLDWSSDPDRPLVTG